jgi:cation diffusion facilitator family transporter
MSRHAVPNAALLEKLARARRAAFVGIIGSGFLGVIKLLCGWLGGSHAVLADGVESAGDAVASVVVLIGVSIAARPPDPEHPYGHGRAEQIAGNTVATLMLASGLFIALSNGAALLSGQPADAPAVYTLAAMLLSVAVKCGLFAYKLSVGRALKSHAVMADAWNDLLDVVSGLAVLVGVYLARGGMPWADRAAALVVAAMIVITAGKLYADASRGLLDEQAPGEWVGQIRRTALGVRGVAGVEKILARRAGLVYFVELHLEVPPQMPVVEAHALGHAVQHALQNAHTDIAGVLIHLEPAKLNTNVN